jgi:multidrug resistance efflux pump
MSGFDRWIICCGIFLVPALAWGQEAATKEGAAKAPETVEAKTEVLRVYESVDARVESQQTAELRMNMDAFTTLVIDTITPPGTQVKKGEVVAKFKSEKLEQQLQDAEFDLQMAAISLQEAENNLAQVIRMNDLDQKLAQQSWDHAQEDVDYYKRVSAPLAERQVKKSLESGEFQVEYAQDELDQLEKMYQEDELTEESEEIVLKRARRSLDQAKFYLETAQIRTDHSLNVEFPREMVKQDQSLGRAKLEYEKAMTSLPAQRQLKELELQKQQFAHEKQRREYEKLKADLARLTLIAPIDGTVYHGQCRRGTWSNAAGGNSRVIEAGATVPKDAVVITIVGLDQLRLRGEVAEKQLHAIRPELIGTARPNSNSDDSFSAKVSEVGSIPVEEGKFDCVLVADPMPKALVPGMTCSVKFLVYENQSAVLVPKASVFSDDDGQTHYVFVQSEDGHQRRDVKIGKSKDDKLEVVSGLKSGEKILKAKPE